MRMFFRAVLADLAAALGLLRRRAAFAATLAVAFVFAHAAFWSLAPGVGDESSVSPGGAFFATLVSIAIESLAPAVFLALFLRAVLTAAGGDAGISPGVAAPPGWIRASAAVFVRLLALGLIVSAGQAWLAVAAWPDPARPEGPPLAALALPTFVAAGAALVALRLSPTLSAAALGRRMDAFAAWRVLDGRFLRFIASFLVLYALFALLATLAWAAIVSLSLLVEEHVVLLLVPIGFGLSALALTLAMTLVLAVDWPRGPGGRAETPSGD